MRSSSKTAAGALLGALLTVALTGCAPVVSGAGPGADGHRCAVGDGAAGAGADPGAGPGADAW